MDPDAAVENSNPYWDEYAGYRDAAEAAIGDSVGLTPAETTWALQRAAVRAQLATAAATMAAAFEATS